jgi:Rieske Fe-S protein
MNDCTRRQLLGRCATAALVPLLGRALAGCARRVDTLRTVSLPAAKDGQGLVVIGADQAPELSQVDGAVLAAAAGSPTVMVARTGAKDTDFVALEARCPHAGCEVTWVPEDHQAECPCHGSRFAPDGAVLAPPARTPLTAYKVTAAAGVVTVDLFTVLGSGGGGLFSAVGPDGKLRLALRNHPELQTIGGSLVGRAPGLGTPLAVVRTGATELRVLDATCTHLGCTVDPAPATRSFDCPCHFSRFAEDGQVLAGPATLPLPAYRVDSFDGALAVITIR